MGPKDDDKAAEADDSGGGNEHNNTHYLHPSLKTRLKAKFLHSPIHIPNLHLKTNESLDKEALSKLEYHQYDGPAQNSHSLLNVPAHKPRDPKGEPCDTKDGDEGSSSGAKDDSVNLTKTPTDIVSFSIPRESIQRKNSEFHLLLDEKLSSPELEDETVSTGNSFFAPVDDAKDSDESQYNPPSVQGSLHMSQTSETPQSIQSFLERPDEEKQEILKEEIDSAMLSLQKTYNVDANLKDSSEDSDAESFVTAEETPLDSPSESRDELMNLPAQGVPESKERKTVSFQTPTSVKMTNATSMYTLQSQRLALDKQTPFPYMNSRSNYNMDEGDEKSQFRTHVHSVNDAYTDIDDELAESYNILKTKTIGAKLGLTGEINKFEHKRKMKKLLQHFQAGEIIKMEKMLVMVSTIEKFKFNSDLKKCTRILERWREYITVVRATNDDDYPAIIQFFKSNQIFKKDDLKKLRKEIYEEELEKQRMEDAEAEEEEEAKNVEDLDSDKVANEEDEYYDSDEKSSTRNMSTIDQELDSFDEENGTVVNADTRNSTLRSTISKLKNTKKKHQTKKKLKGLKSKLSNNKPKSDEDPYFDQLPHDRKNKNCHFSLVISRHDVNVEFANLLDKSIRITKEKKRCTIIYTLLTHSTSSAIVWFSFLRQLLSSKVADNAAKSMLISIPSLNISFTITGAKTFYKAYIAERVVMSDHVMIKYSKDGYQYPQIKSFEEMLEIIERKVTELEKYGKLPSDATAKEFLKKLRTDKSFLALTFRKYDRLEWILGESELIVQILWNIFASSYELELREFQHESHILGDNSLVEPLPIEGFVVKLSNRRGKLASSIGRQYYKLLYAFTVENLLFLQDFYNAVPVLPYPAEPQRKLISPAGDVLNLKGLEEASSFDPTTYQQTPYPRTMHHVQWLKPGITPEEYADHDADAFYEAERRACMISNASGVVDLCKVKDIRLVPKQDISLVVRTASRATWKIQQLQSTTTNKSLFRTISGNVGAVEDDEYVENCLDLVMENGSILRLQVSSRTIRNEWAKNLGKLSEYWTLKKREDLIRHVLLKEKNLTLMNTHNDDFYESLIANENEASCSKWEMSKAYTDTQLYSISSYVLDKPVLMEGYIYCKKFKSKQFRLFYAVLSPGVLVVYDIFKRSKRTGVARNSTYYRRYAAISLASCYVFANTGKSSTDSKGKVFFSLSSGEDGLPRVYGDGWRSSESAYERSFTLWFGSKKIMMKNIKEKIGTRLSADAKRDSVGSEVNSFQSTSDYESSDSDIDENTKPKKSKKTGGKKMSKRLSFSRLRKKNKNSSEENQKAKDYGTVSASSDESTDNSNDEVGVFRSSSESETDTDTDTDTGAGSDFDSSTDYEYDKEVFDVSDTNVHERISTRELLKSASRLGVTGRAIIFLARSRVDRDLWVTRLMTEVERFSENRNNDIQLV
ncbi:hypothetical protein PMKS-003818 [Pichia membranifaciens]|uniref:PH domain-containing protein n=1 Tax=Pichia membranifaciens TaxID=4926 RepID=A0A1Q2YL83_9ASCO|nr:hypothetical protein PMKS-003818 [Pichia membranifaciens]